MLLFANRDGKCVVLFIKEEESAAERECPPSYRGPGSIVASPRLAGRIRNVSKASEQASLCPGVLSIAVSRTWEKQSPALSQASSSAVYPVKSAGAQSRLFTGYEHFGCSPWEWEPAPGCPQLLKCISYLLPVASVCDRIHIWKCPDIFWSIQPSHFLWSFCHELSASCRQKSACMQMLKFFKL